MRLIEAVRPVDGVRSRRRRAGLCPGRGRRQELRRSLQRGAGCAGGGLRGLLRNTNNSDCFLVPFPFPEKCLTCELLLETPCGLTRRSSGEEVASASAF